MISSLINRRLWLWKNRLVPSIFLFLSLPLVVFLMISLPINGFALWFKAKFTRDISES